MVQRYLSHQPIEKKGFTLVELVIGIVVIALLSMISVPIYRSYVRRAIVSEGERFASSMMVAIQLFYNENGGDAIVSNSVSFSSMLDQMSAENTQVTKYFKLGDVHTSRSENHLNCRVTVEGIGSASGIKVICKQRFGDNPKAPEIILEGL